MLPTLTGARTRLRSLRAEPGDLQALLDLYSQPQVVRFLGLPLMRTLEDAGALVAQIDACVEARTLFQWGVERADAPGVIGHCTLSSLDWQNRRAEVGFSLHPAQQGRGLATDAVRALVDHAFDDLDLHRLEADVDPRNEASLRLLERVGFAREGYMPERHLIEGEWQDTVFLGLLRASRAPSA